MHDARRRAAVARALLAEAVGVPVAALEGIKLDFAELQATRGVSPGKAKRAALTNRTDILAALADYAAAESTLRLEIAKQYPGMWRLGPGYELDQEENKWRLGVSLELPVNRNRGRIAGAGAARGVSAAKFLQVQAKALAEIERLHAEWNGVRSKVEAAKEIAEEQRGQVSATERMKQAGRSERSSWCNGNSKQTRAPCYCRMLRHASERRGATSEDALQVPAGLPTTLPQRP